MIHVMARWEDHFEAVLTFTLRLTEEYDLVCQVD